MAGQDTLYSDQDVYYGALSNNQAYEGASTNFRLEQRGLLRGEPDFLSGRELRFLQYRSEHAVRNNAYAGTIVQKLRQNQGAITVKWVINKGKKQGEIHQEMQDYWDEFAENPNLDKYGSLANTQDEWTVAMPTSGEVFCRKLIQRRKGITIPLVLQNIPASFLDPLYSAFDPLHTRNGITFKDGAPDIYHFDARPIGWSYGFYTKDGYNSVSAPTFQKILVPADEVCHIFQRDGRPGQWRGVPTLASLLLPLYELDDLNDALVSKQKAAQAIAWIVENTNPASSVAIGNATQTYNPAEIDPATGQRKMIMKTNGGGVQYTNKGETVKPIEGTGLGNSVIDLIKLELHKIALRSGITYQMLTGDFENTNMSILQQLALDMRTSAEWHYNFLTIPLGLRKITGWFSELAPLYGTKQVVKAVPEFHFPVRYSVNRLEDAQADLLELDGNLEPYHKVLTRRGNTPEQMKADKEIQKEAGASFSRELGNTSLAQAKNNQANSNSKGR